MALQLETLDVKKKRKGFGGGEVNATCSAILIKENAGITELWW